jgi:hypothetical protein
MFSGGMEVELPTLLGKLSFRDNMKPSEVTDDVRNELVRRERKSLFKNLLMTVYMTIALAWAILAGYANDPESSWPLSQSYSFQAVVVALVVAGIIGTRLRRIRFIRSAYVTKGVVLDTEISSYYDRGGGQHTAKVIYRFVPIELRDGPDSELLSTSAPHVEGRAKLGAHWGGFGDDLKAGDLISVLYEPETPTHSVIVPLKRRQE